MADAGQPVSAVGGVAELYAASYGRLVGALTVATGSRADAEEVVQEAFARLLVRGSGIDNPSAYLHRAVVNRSRDVLRRRAVLRRHVPERARVVTPEDGLLDAVRRLPARQRAVVVLRFYEDRTVDQIAETLGMRPGTVKSHLHRAMQELRRVVER